MNNAFSQPQTAIVLGGTSEIAGALMKELVAARCRTVVLAGRDSGALDKSADALRTSGASVVETVHFEAIETTHAPGLIEEVFAKAGGEVDLVVIAVGSLGDQAADEVDPARVVHELTVNFTWPAAVLTAVAAKLRSQGQGHIVVLSSVAGVRVRRANFIYGSAKAGLDGFATGLAASLAGSGVRLHVVRPGFVRTKMTAGRKPAPFSTDPPDVASAIVRGLERGDEVIWVPPILQWVFLVMQNLPRFLWRRLPET